MQAFLVSESVVDGGYDPSEPFDRKLMASANSGPLGPLTVIVAKDIEEARRIANQRQ